jgi:type I restriction enzyme S subunit
MRKKLKDVCMFYSGTGFPIQYQGQTKGEYPFYKVGDIANNAIAGKIYLELCNNYISSDVAKMIKGCILPKDTVVFAKIGEALKLNRRAITSCDCLIDNNAMGIAPKLDSLRIQYFYFCMKNLKMQTLAESTTVPSVRKTVLEKYEIEVPSLVEQEEIEKKLTLTQKIIEKRRQELSYLDEIIKARFVEMFGDITTGNYKYDTRKLGDVANVGSSHRVFTTEFVKKGIPFYRGTEIGELANGNKPTEPFYISEEHYNRLVYNDTKPQVGDLLLPSICNKGQVWMVDTDEPFYYKDGRVLCISPDREIFDTKYLEYFMKAKTLVEYPKLGSGSTFAEFKIFLLKDIDVLIPPRELQEQFSIFVNQVDKSKVAVQKALDETQILFDSLMQKYFG